MILAHKYKKDDFLKVIHEYQLEDYIDFTKTVKVLYVDNEEHRDDFLGIFKIFFHDITVATDGDEAYKCFLDNKYDLIITTVDMPKINGVELISKVRKISRDITVLVLSQEEKYFIELIRLGVDGYILQPVEVVQFVSIIQKVIEKLHSKQALYEHRIELEKIVEKKTQDLKILNYTLEERIKLEVEKNKKHEDRLNEQAKLVSMGEMIENIAHQWRQPLSVISTASTGMLLQKELDMLSDEQFIENCKYINKNAQYLSNTIDDFRNFILGDSVLIEFNLEDTLKSFLKLVDATIKEANIEVILEIDTPIKLKGFPNELIQCFINIFNNSKDAFIANKVDELERYFSISQIIKNNEIVLLFQDNAGGIPKEIIPKIFNPYFTTKHQSQGTGLGLYMSYNLITTNMNGTLEVHNKEFVYANKEFCGALFTITLPFLVE